MAWTRRIFITIVSVLALSGCANIPRFGARDIANGIERDALRLNNARAHATNSIILQNILWARDRWPTNYSTISGITANPKIAATTGTTLSPIGLGNPTNPFGKSTATISRNVNSSASYNINPIGKGDSTSGSLLTPISTEIMKHYWESGWPKDVLFWMFVNDIKFENEPWIHLDGKGYAQKNGQEGNAEKILKKFLGLDIDTIKKTPAEIKNKLDNIIIGTGYQNKAKASSPNCPVLKSRVSTEKLFSTEKANNALSQISTLKDLAGKNFHIHIYNDQNITYYQVMGCEGTTTFVGNQTNVPKKEKKVEEIRLRSLDGMVYFLGEIERSKSKKTRGNIVQTICPGSETKSADLFNIHKKSAKNFAAHVQYNGVDYVAGDAEADKDEDCDDGRTNTVLALLSQLFIIQQSDDFLKAPDQPIIQR